VVDFLEKAGFVVLPLQTAPPELTISEILWRRTSAEEKEVVASYLTLLPTRADKDHTRSTAVTIVIGQDFPGLEGVSG
jgi:hypothetical protein